MVAAKAMSTLIFFFMSLSLYLLVPVTVFARSLGNNITVVQKAVIRQLF